MVERQGVTHIDLLVAEVHRARAFYERVFGLRELSWDGPGMVFLRPPGTEDTITLQQSPDASRGTSNIDHFGFRLADRRQLDRAIEEVIAGWWYTAGARRTSTRKLVRLRYRP